MSLRTGSFPYRLLSVATPEPLPLKTLTALIGQQGYIYSTAAVSKQIARLVEADYLRREAARDGCIRYRYALTPVGQAELSRLASPGPMYGKTARALLSVASGAPQTRGQLVHRLFQRGTSLRVGRDAMNEKLARLAHDGLLERSGVGCAHRPYEYALTRAGEAELDRMAGAR